VAPTSLSLKTSDDRDLIVSYLHATLPSTATITSPQAASGSGYGFTDASTTSTTNASASTLSAASTTTYSGTSEDPADLTRVFQLDMGQLPLDSYNAANPPTCSFESPNHPQFSCLIGSMGLSYDYLKYVFWGGLRFATATLQSNFLPVKKYVIRQVLDINGSTNYDSITRVKAMDNSLYFEASVSGSTRFVRFDPNSPSSVQRVIGEYSSGDYISQAAYHDAKVYFGGASSSGYLTGFAYDPNDNSLARLTNTTGGQNDHATYFASDGSSNLYFAANASSEGVRLMLFNGSEITQLSHISDSAVTGGDEPKDIQVYDSRVYFSAQNNAYGVRKLFVYDPTTTTISNISNTSGTSTISDAPRSLTWANDKLYFIANNTSGFSKLYAYDPNDSSVTQLTDFATSTSNDFTSSARLMDFGGALYFPMTDVSNSTKLYRYRFADGNIEQVSNTNSAGSDNIGEHMAAHGGALYFTAFKNSTTCSLYRYNPVQNKTEAMANPAGAAPYSCPKELTSFYDGLYFVGNSASYADKLYRLSEE